MIKKYKSNSELSGSSIGLISLADTAYIFTTKIKADNPDKLYFKLTVSDETANKNYSFEIDNSLKLTQYDSNIGVLSTKPFYYKKDSFIKYFGETFQIKNNKLYKLLTADDLSSYGWADYYIIDGNTYATKKDNTQEDYHLSISGPRYIIKKKIDKNVKPLCLYSWKNDKYESEIIDYMSEFHISGEKWFRFIVSEDAKLISIWVKNSQDDVFKKIKTFSYPGGIEKATIKLEYEDSIELNDLSFSFFKTDVE